MRKLVLSAVLTSFLLVVSIATALAESIGPTP
jgi:hypothetical protein